MQASQDGIPHCHPELFKTKIERGPVRIEDYAGTAESVVHHKKHWLRNGYLSDLVELFPKLIRDDGTVLEVGCGMGHLHHHLGIPRARYTGLDMNEAFLAEGRRNFPGINLLHGKGDQLPFADAHFDHVMCSDVLIHCADMLPTLKELIRVARKDVLLRIRTGDGSAQGAKLIYDPQQERLFVRLHLGGEWRYFYYNVILADDLRRLLELAGVTDYQVFDVGDGSDGRMALTKVFFKVPGREPAS